MRTCVLVLRQLFNLGEIDMEYKIPAFAMAMASRFVAQPKTENYDALGNVAFYRNKYGRPELAACDGYAMVMISWGGAVSPVPENEECFALRPLPFLDTKGLSLEALVRVSIEYVTPKDYRGDDPHKAYHVVCDSPDTRPVLNLQYEIAKDDYGVLPGIVARNDFYTSWRDKIMEPDRTPPKEDRDNGKVYGCSYALPFDQMLKMFHPALGTPTLKACGPYVAVHYLANSALPYGLTVCSVIMSFSNAPDGIAKFGNALGIY